MYLNVEKKNSKSYQDRRLSFFTPYNSPHKLKLCTFCAPIPLMLCYKRPVRAVLKIFSTACVKNNILYILQLVWLNYFTLVTNGTQETINFFFFLPQEFVLEARFYTPEILLYFSHLNGHPSKG